MPKPKNENCKMCGKYGRLSRCHIYPRWMGTLNETGKMGQFTTMTFNNEKVELVNENGIINLEKIEDEIEFEEKYGRGLPAEFIFCESCDNELGKGEEILKDLFYPKSIDLLKNKVILSTKKVSFTYFTSFKMKHFRDGRNLYKALAGIVLKAHYASNHPFENFRIAPGNFSAIKSLATGIRPSGQSSLEIIFMKLYNFPNYRIEGLEHKFVLPEDSPNNQFGIINISPSVYFIMMGGIAVIFSYSNSKNKRDKPISGIEKWPIAPIDIRHFLSEKYFTRVEGLLKMGEENKMIEAFFSYNPEDLCPCHRFYSDVDKKRVRRSFSECCSTYWEDVCNQIILDAATEAKGYLITEVKPYDDKAESQIKQFPTPIIMKGKR